MGIRSSEDLFDGESYQWESVFGWWSEAPLVEMWPVRIIIAGRPEFERRKGSAVATAPASVVVCVAVISPLRPRRLRNIRRPQFPSRQGGQTVSMCMDICLNAVLGFTIIRYGDGPEPPTYCTVGSGCSLAV
nr:hypothetical protein CFP56_56481 [Quercus suber]